MKKTFLLAILSLLGMSQAVAQEYEDYEYVPFVREGVKWVYYYCEKYQPMAETPSPFVCLTLEFKGDTVINGKTYKLMHKYHGESINTENDTVPICMREENKMVYAIVPNGIFYTDCPIGDWYKINFEEGYSEAIQQGREFILYDFRNPITYWADFHGYFELISTEIIEIGKHHVKQYNLFSNSLAVLRVIEGIGNEANDCYPLAFWLPSWASFVEYESVGLSYVIEDGEIIYDHDSSFHDWDYPDWYRHEYVPFVREGVKWVYYYNNPFSGDILEMPEGKQYYSFEMKGDVLIGNKHYKQVCLTHYLDDENKEAEEFIPVYLREEDKVVYAIHPGGIMYPQCPVGIGSYIGSTSSLPMTTTNEEYILYDFNDPITLYEANSSANYMETDYINVGAKTSKRHHYDYTNNDLIIEGIGYDGDAGMPLFYFEKMTTGLQVGYFLSHVVENGEIIYKGIHFDQGNHVGINEVVAEQSRRVVDRNYYNLMGQPVGKQVPQTPGIYIHNGRKIVVR